MTTENNELPDLPIDTEPVDENLFNEIIEEEDNTKQIEDTCNTTENTPSVTSLEWNHYVLAQLDETEKENGHPTCDGLRRITELLIGLITKREVKYCFAPSVANGIATVCVSIEVQPCQGSVFNSYLPLRSEAIADCGNYNTEKPFCLHQSATAETRAEARALRKLLRLRKIIAAEEITPNEILKEVVEIPAFELNEMVTEEQLNLMDILAKRGNVNMVDLLKMGKQKFASLQEIPKDVALSILEYLNSIVRGVKTKPSGVSDYNQGWRSDFK